METKEKDMDCSLESIIPRNKSQLVLSVQKEITQDTKQLWLIRHGERMDEVYTEESKKWRKNIEMQRLFDPPLTKKGFNEASKRGILLIKELYKIQNKKDVPTCIYASPTERTLGTAQQIAIHTKLPIIVMPGLAACAAAVKRGGLMKEHPLHYSLLQKCTTTQVVAMVSHICGSTKELKAYKALFVAYFEQNGICGQHLCTLEGKQFVDDICKKLKNNKLKKYAMTLYSALIEYDLTQFYANDDNKVKECDNNDDDDGYELFLRDYKHIGKCNFLTKRQILKQFATNNGVDIKFDYRYIESYKECVDRLVAESKSKIILCVTHREGIRKLGDRLKKTKIPYCALAKYGCIETTQKYQLEKTFDYLYFVDDEKSKQKSVKHTDKKYGGNQDDIEVMEKEISFKIAEEQGGDYIENIEELSTESLDIKHDDSNDNKSVEVMEKLIALSSI